MLHSFCQWILRHRLALFLAGIVLTALCYPIARRLEYDKSVRSLFSQDHPRLLTYQRMEDDFGGDSLSLCAYDDPDLLTREGMARLGRFADQLRAVDGVLSVTCLADMPRPLDPTMMATLQRAMLRTGQEGGGVPWKTLGEWYQDPSVSPETLREEILGCDLFINWFISVDGHTAGLALQINLKQHASGDISETLKALRRTIETDAPGPGAIVGAPIMISDVYRNLDQDAWTLTYVSSSAMMLAILALFRSLRWMILPMMIVQFAVTWNQALMVLTNIRLSIIGSMTTSMVTVIGIATTIHIAVRFREDSQVHPTDPNRAMLKTLEQMVPAVFWTCLTTAVGFAALQMSQVAPLRAFGVIMVSSSMFVGLASLLIIPGGVLIGQRFRSVPNAAMGEDQLEDGLGQVIRLVGRYSLATAVFMLSVFALAMFGYGDLKVETDFTKNFRESSTILTGYRFVENKLGGAGLIDVIFDVPETLTPELVEQIRACEKELRQLPGVTKVVGLADLTDFLQNAMNAPQEQSGGGLFSQATGLLRRQGNSSGNLMLATMLRLLPRFKKDIPLLDGMWNEEAQRMRIFLRVKEQAAVDDKAALVENIERIADEHFGEKGTDVTGLYILLVYLIDSVLADQVATFTFGMMGILFCTIIAFRSVRQGIVAFLPNIVPIVATTGVMGWLGMKLNFTTAMISSIAMGLVVDFSIHYLFRYNEERRQGFGFFGALAKTHTSTGKAMVFANFSLMLGFSILMISEFMPTVHFGMLVSVAILGGLIGNLLMLPVLMRLFYWVRYPANLDDTS